MNKKIISMFVVGAILMLSAGIVFAYQGNPEIKGPNYSEDRHIAMQKAFDNVDYDAWSELMMQDGRTPGVLRKVTKENFATFVEARKLAERGDSEGALELRVSLGLSQKNEQHSGVGCDKNKAESGCQKRTAGTCPHAN